MIYPTTAAAAQRLCLSSRAVKRLRQRKYPDYGKKKNWQPEPVGADKVLQVVKPGAPLGIARGFGHGGMRGQQTVIAHAEDLIPARHRSEEHTSELQSRFDLVCRLLLEKKKKNSRRTTYPQ